MTMCGGCHRHEAPAPEITTGNAFVSDVFRPLASEIVQIDFMRQESTSCDSRKEPDRCAMLHAIFDQGRLDPWSFSDQAATIYDN